MQNTKVLLKLLQLDLEQHRPGAAVKSVAIEARPARRRRTQGALFAPAAPEPESLAITLARIRGLVGEVDERGRGKVGAAEVLDSHQSDDFRMSVFRPGDNKHMKVGNDAPSPSVTMSMFRPPLPANVRCRTASRSISALRKYRQRLSVPASPWRTSGNWWKSEEWRREEWDIAVQLASGVGLYRIFRDLRRDTWFVEGLYD